MTQPSKPRNIKEALGEIEEGLAVLENTSEDADAAELNESVNHSIEHLNAGQKWFAELKRFLEI